VVIDLRQLTFLDSTGIAALVEADSYARRDGWNLAIVKGPPQVQRVLELCGLTEVLPLADQPVA
jgi:anti-sigma B factor antagonist